MHRTTNKKLIIFLSNFLNIIVGSLKFYRKENEVMKYEIKCVKTKVLRVVTDILLQGWGRTKENQLLKGSPTSPTCIDRKGMEIKTDKRLVLIDSVM